MSGRRGPHPFFYFLLFLPFGASSGFVYITLGYIGTKNGLTVGQVGTLVAIHMLPQTWKFFWAPASDALWTRKGWYVVSCLVCAGGVAGMGLVPMTPANLGLFEILVFANSIASTFVAMSGESIMAHATPIEERGRAGGWSQAGNLGGSGIGGGLGLYLAEHLAAQWMATVLLGSLMAACMIGLQFVPEPHKEEGPLAPRVRAVVRDLWSVIRSKGGVIALALCFLPIGSGAAAGLFSSVAGDWKASADLVSWMNGWLSGGVMAIGCLFGGRLSDAFHRRNAYMLSSAILAGCALAMGLAPQTPTMYAIGCLAYSFASGLVYGSFTAYILEVIGGGAAATKYNTFASLSNIPITYMTKVDSWAAEKHGSATMLVVDAASCAIGLVVLIAVIGVLALIWRDRDGATPAAAA